MSEKKSVRITSSERAELRRIIKARFAILTNQLRERQNEFQQEIRQRIVEEHRASAREAQKATAKLREKARKLEEEAKALEEKYAELGLAPSSSPDGLYYRHHQDLVTIDFAEHWAPTGIDEKVSEAWQQIATQAGLHSLNLQMTELELMEGLAVSALDSEAAKEFMAKVPTIDKLLPAPNGNVSQAIEAARE